MSIRKRGAVSPGAVGDVPAEMSAEEAEALAAAAEAEAAAARARANALRLRRAEAAQEESAGTAGDPEIASGREHGLDSETGGVETPAEDLVVEASEVPAGHDDPPAAVRRSVTVTKYAAVVLAVLAIAALASTSAWIVVKHRQAEQQRDLDAQFSSAARTGVVSLMSLDFNRAQEDVQRILDNSTGQFREDFASQAEEFAEVAESSKVVTTANVTATAVQTMTEDTAEVLVSAASTVTNAQGAKEDPRSWRLIVSMARDGDQIKMAKVEFAP